MFTGFEIATVAIALAVVVCVVLLHYEALRFLTRWMAATRLRPRMRIAALLYALLALHAVEIGLFGGAYWVLDLGYGSVLDATDLRWDDYVYFSATVYSTVGFGDLVPVGPVRLIAGIEGVAGLLLITWSASFTYLEMTRYWRDMDGGA